MRRVAPFVIVVLVLLAGRADAVTIKEIIELTRAGLSDEVILALIEVDPRVYTIDPATLKELKAAGVSERVIVAMVRSGRNPVLPEPPVPVVAPEPPPPQVVVIEREPVVREVVVPVAVPVYYPVVTHVRRGHAHHPVNPAVPREFPSVGSFPVEPVRVVPKEPVYWGWGGKLRPDAWKPAPHEAPRQRRD
jgi:hypothetical protein